MSSQGQRIIITQATHSPLPTCSPNLMPFHIEYTGPAAVSMFLRVEKMKPEEEVKELDAKMEVVPVDEKDGGEDEAKEVMVKEGEGVDEAKVDCKPVIDEYITKDENNETNVDPNEDVEMKTDTLAPIVTVDPVQAEDSQPPDVEMTTVLPTQTSSSPILLPTTSSSTKTIQASASTSTLVASDSFSSLTLTSSSTPSSSTLPQTSSSVLKDIDKRFISSFRGRTIHGLTVDLPTGYTGLLLQGDPQSTENQNHATTPGVKSGFEGDEELDDGAKGGRKTRSKKGKGKEKEATKKTAAPRGRLARTAAPKHKAEPEVISIDEEMTEPARELPALEFTESPSEPINDDTNPLDSLDNDKDLDEGIPLRKLIPQSTFSSITLWHADRAVDETRDEYYRTLTEWMALSHEIHRTDL